MAYNKSYAAAIEGGAPNLKAVKDTVATRLQGTLNRLANLSIDTDEIVYKLFGDYGVTSSDNKDQVLEPSGLFDRIDYINSQMEKRISILEEHIKRIANEI